MFSGVKTRLGMLGLDTRAHYNVCDTDAIKRATVKSMADWLWKLERMLEL